MWTSWGSEERSPPVGERGTLQIREGAQSWVEHVAEGVAHEVDGDHRGHDGRPRTRGDPPAA